MFKFSGLIIWRLGSRSTLRKYSNHGAALFRNEKVEISKGVSEIEKLSDKESTGLVAAAFAALNAPESEHNPPSYNQTPHNQSKVQELDLQITKAHDVDSLLAVAENPFILRRQALKMISVLSELSNSNKVKLADFDKDPRFLKLCRILGRTPLTKALMSSVTMPDDMSTVLGVTGDDEVARLIVNLSFPQMIKVMQALQQKGRRSTPLLRTLSYNIMKHTEVIDIKKSADLLYCMAALNFPDPVLLDRLCNDIITSLPSDTNRPAAVGSILVSLGLLKYRHVSCLDALLQWPGLRPQDMAAALLTMATLDYLPQNDRILEVALSLKEEDMSNSSAWLDLVFSLLILDKAEKHHFLSTMRPEFSDKLFSSGDISISARRKLIAIDAYAALKYPNECPPLGEHVTLDVPILYTKEKELYVHCIMDTFKNLISADSFLKKNCYSGMGFLYDAEFAVDGKCHPVPLNKAVNNENIFRIAVLGLDYHDMTRKTIVPLGVFQLYTRLLQMKGFHVLQIPYTEFNPKDKLVTRVQFIEKGIKELVNH